MLGEAADGSLIHIELQSRNDAAIAARMLVYATGILQAYERLPRQVLLYVGLAPLAMPAVLEGPTVRCQFTALDIRTIDSDALLESPEIGDAVGGTITRRTQEHADN